MSPEQPHDPRTQSLDTLPPAPAAWEAPEAIPGYELLGELGRGGMGVVFRARHEKLNRPVAVKMLLAGASATPAARARFLAEAETVARLPRPGVAPIHELGELPDGPPFFS